MQGAVCRKGRKLELETEEIQSKLLNDIVYIRQFLERREHKPISRKKGHSLWIYTKPNPSHFNINSQFLFLKLKIVLHWTIFETLKEHCLTISWPPKIYIWFGSILSLHNWIRHFTPTLSPSLTDCIDIEYSKNLSNSLVSFSVCKTEYDISLLHSPLVLFRDKN